MHGSALGVQHPNYHGVGDSRQVSHIQNFDPTNIGGASGAGPRGSGTLRSARAMAGESPMAWATTWLCTWCSQPDYHGVGDSKQVSHIQNFDPTNLGGAVGIWLSADGAPQRTRAAPGLAWSIFI